MGAIYVNRDQNFMSKFLPHKKNTCYMQKCVISFFSESKMKGSVALRNYKALHDFKTLHYPCA